jgi:predicted permease
MMHDMAANIRLGPASLAADLGRDLRYGARILRRSPAFSAVAVLTLGLGIGAATAVFSVVNGVLLAPLPYPDAHRVVRVFQIDETGRRMGSVSEPNYLDWRGQTQVFAASAQVASGPVPVGVRGETTMVTGAVVSREFFDVMAVRPAIGSGFPPDALHPGGAPVAVISERLWRTRLQSAPLETLALRIDETPHQVVGVMPAFFDYPVGAEFWTPRELLPPDLSRTAHNWVVVARLATGVPLDRAIGDLSALSRRLKAQHGDGTWMSDATAVPLGDQLTASARPALLLLFGASIVLLAIACLNVSNLQLARASSRRRELAVRLAVGAGRGRLVRQLVAESAVLSAAAAALGTALAWMGVRLLLALEPANLPRLREVSVQADVLLFAVGIAALTATVLGLATALRASRQDVRDALAEGTRTAAGGRAVERVRQTLAVAQIALTIVLLAGAGLLARSFVALLSVDPGYRTEDSLLLDLQWSSSREPAIQQRRKVVQEELLTALAAVPGVENVGLVNEFPLGGRFYANGQFIEMTRVDELRSFDDLRALGPEAKSRAGFAGYRIASEGYFRAMGIRLVRGRLFEPSDTADAPHVAVISESLAEARWPDQDPIGRFVQFGNMDGDLRGFRIVGIVSDVREAALERVPEPLFYGYYKQRMASRFTIVAQTGRTAQVALAAQQLVRRADPDLPLQVRTIEQALDRALAGRRFSLTLIGLFSTLALVLATLGVYGLISYLVAERTREIGIRLALGADPGDVLRLVLGRAALLAGVGVAAGIAGAAGLTRLIAGMLFGVTPTDPIAFMAVPLVTLAAVLLASYVPARRAMRVSPVTAMTAE